ncbi:uncharacterized protein LOC111086931 [Limulus polyphemus]|uniref:Uncharacterized protein LOC111086931 n=1 Tax=Limulus polyphemus TaxID=6850 RepID=A0ABM1SV54_LIMPO|nr:uncharacterized protein LOC111086931 [Limulus polyphemus]
MYMLVSWTGGFDELGNEDFPKVLHDSIIKYIIRRGYRRIKPKVPQDLGSSLFEMYDDIPKAVGVSEKTYMMIINSFFVNGNEAKTVAREVNVTEELVKSVVSLHLKYNLHGTGNQQPNCTSHKPRRNSSQSIKLSAKQEELLVQYKRQNTRVTLKDLQTFVREDRDTFPQITDIDLSTLYNILKKHGINTSRRHYEFHTKL